MVTLWENEHSWLEHPPLFSVFFTSEKWGEFPGSYLRLRKRVICHESFQVRSLNVTSLRNDDWKTTTSSLKKWSQEPGTMSNLRGISRHSPDISLTVSGCLMLRVHISSFCFKEEYCRILAVGRDVEQEACLAILIKFQTFVQKLERLQSFLTAAKSKK